jgi:cytochrome bd-type quinol oxidase subunit 1
VQGVLATVDAASDVPAPMIGLSLTIYLLVYAVLIAAYVSVLFHMAGKAGHAPPFGTRSRAAAEGPPVMPYVSPDDERERNHA